MAALRELPDAARCVIIGGGVGGTSIAYHLAELGWDDVVLVDRNQLTSGSTFHSAGLVGQLRGSVSLTKMMMYSVELYRRLGSESDFDPGWTECGGIRLASSEERMEELRRQAGWAKTFGLPLDLISADEAQERFPAHVHRRGAGRRVAADRRLPRSLPADLRAGRRRPAWRRSDLHLHARDRDRERRRARHACTHRARGHRGRGRGHSGRHVLGRARADGGRAHPGPADVTRVHRDPAVSRPRPGEPPPDACATPTC